MTELIHRGPSRSWLDRLPLGNGRIGAMVGAGSRAVRIGLNESSVWSGGPASDSLEQVLPADAARALTRAEELFDAGDPLAAEVELGAIQHRYAQTFLPVGELVLELLGCDEGTAVTRSLSLGDALHSAGHRSAGADITSRTAVMWEPDVLVHESRVIRGSSAMRISFDSPLQVEELDVTSDGIRAVLVAPADAAPTHEPSEPARTAALPGIDPVRAVVVVALQHDGRGRAEGGAVTVTAASALRVVVALETTFTRIGGPTGQLADALARAARRAAVEFPEDPFPEHASRQRERHQRVGPSAPSSTGEVEPAVLLADPDPATLLPVLFEYGRYLLRSSSRAGGQPANLQGIWNAELRPPWSSDFTLNINTPMNYWGAEPTGESGAHLALLELLEGLADRGRDTAARLYGARGWVAHHNSDAWAYSLPTRGDAAWAIWPFGGAWLVRQFDEHRRFGEMSASTLRRFWPVARGAAEFLLDFARKRDGRISTFPSTSPENTYVAGRAAAALTRSSALDLALLREVFALVPEVASAAGAPDDDVARRCADALGRIAPPSQDADGGILEWGSDVEALDPSHRHVSHLFPWYPGDSGPPDEAEAVRRTLDRRGDDSTGWSLAWKLGLAARLGDVERIDRLLPLVVRTADDGESHRGGLYPNLFAAHPPFQIDGNLGLVGAVAEMLVQSHRPGRIDLLPALPSCLPEGRVTGLVARPGITVEIRWSGGRLTHASLVARSPAAAGPVTVTVGSHSRRIEVPHGTGVVLDATLQPPQQQEYQ